MLQLKGFDLSLLSDNSVAKAEVFLIGSRLIFGALSKRTWLTNSGLGGL